jgi:uncharacterized small protein (DUF1192 family)
VIPRPRDPRTPLQAALDKHDATARILRTMILPKAKRLELADRLAMLQAEITRLKASS